MTNAELIMALQTDIREVEDDSVKTLRLMWRAADAIERLMDEIDRKDKALQAFLKQIEQMIAERKKLRDTLIESICVNCDTPPDVRLRVCGECPIIQPIREVFDE